MGCCSFKRRLMRESARNEKYRCLLHRAQDKRPDALPDGAPNAYRPADCTSSPLALTDPNQDASIHFGALGTTHPACSSAVSM